MPTAAAAAALGTTASPSAGLSAELELLLVAETIVQLSGRVLPRFGHFLHQFLRLDDLFQHLALVGFAEHAAYVHFEQDCVRWVVQ